MTPITIYTIGHSRHPIETFLDLLRQHEIECLVDVRTSPYSRFSPHFRRKALEEHLACAGIDYVFLGESLGGRPDDKTCYDDAGKVDYGRISERDWYRDGIESLLASAAEQRVAIMCAEEDPQRCHRHLLINQTLLKESLADVLHIRKDGRIERAALGPSQSRRI